MYDMLSAILDVLYNDNDVDKDLTTYLNAWTKSNDSMTREYLLQRANSPRVRVWYKYSNTSNDKCLSTYGMPWQDLQSWKLINCSVEDKPLLLDYRNPIKKEDYDICAAL